MRTLSFAHYFRHGTPCRGGSNSPSILEGVPEGRGSNMDIRIPCEYTCRFGLRATAFRPLQIPLPRPTATPSPRKGNCPSAAAARCGQNVLHIFVFSSCFYTVFTTLPMIILFGIVIFFYLCVYVIREQHVV